MKAGDAIAAILKREGVETIIGYPVNHVLEHAAVADIRPIIVRQERTGIHMADAISRLSSGRRIGVFAMQPGPGTESSYGAIAQACSESVPIPVLPGGYPRRLAHIEPNYNATISMRNVAKSVEPLNVPADMDAVVAELDRRKGAATALARDCRRDRRGAGGLAQGVDAEADFQRGAPVPLSRAVGPAEIGGRGQYHHNPRRRQPSGPALAVLGGDCRSRRTWRVRS
jgi:Thiamine pyrophosphate enzyme, N-terminal TPP binding domain